MKKYSIIIKMLPIYCIATVLLLLIAIKGSQAVTTYVANQQIIRKNCIIIDPGHGGIDGGATSYSGVLESQLNLEIAKRLNDLFHLLGIDTIMTRESDESIHIQGTTIAQKKVSDLKERVRIVNQKENALLISIHQNHYSDNRYYGPQVFYKMGQGSQSLAMQAQTALNNALCKESNRKAKQSKDIYLLDKINTNGILVECGFLSNPAEDLKLQNADYQKKLCIVIASVTSNYLNNDKIT